MPGYRTSSYAGKWHCDINVNGHLFRTVRQCGSQGEAQNTAAHVAMYEISISHIIDTSSIAPADVTSVTTTGNGSNVTKKKGNPARVGAQATPAKGGKGGSQASQGAALPPKPQQSSNAPGSSKSSRKKRKRNNSAPFEPAAKRTKEGGAPNPAPAAGQTNKQGRVAHGANAVDLAKSRLPALQSEAKPAQKPAESRLMQLKAVQAGLNELPRTASFWRVAKSKLPENVENDERFGS